MHSGPRIELVTFDVSTERGFLPAHDPLEQLPTPFTPWEDIARDLPKLLAAGCARPQLDALPVQKTASLRSDAELNRAMLLLSYFGHAYVWGGAPPSPRVPESVAVPWQEIAARLGRPPVLSYASYALHNWRRLDPRRPIALGNIALRQNFLGGVDEEWFILVHVQIEAEAAPALTAIPRALMGVESNEAGALTAALETVAGALREMHATLSRMTERCDPYIYFHRVRPYIHGWKDQPALPDGLIYDGVPAYSGRPQQFRGETGAQSSIVPSLDALLGIAHADDPLRAYLREMRDYMPLRHREFIAAVEHGPSVRAFTLRNREPKLVEAYNACVHGVQSFRAKHLEYAASYVHEQSQRGVANPSAVGTGGTPFMAYLKKHRDETEQYLIP